MVALPEDIARLALPRLNRYIPHTPHPAQALFLHLQTKEALYGGAAGGGKTDALLMAALQYADVPGYAATLFRRTYPELAQPGGLIPRAKDWLRGTGATWNEQRKQFHFPEGSVLAFNTMQHSKDIDAHERGPDFQFIGFDELTTFEEQMYRRLFSRLRGPSSGPLSKVPRRVRAGTNPGGVGHAWVKQRFLVEGKAKQRPFVRARMGDNPTLDVEGYREALAELDPVTRRRMEDGDWEVAEGGAVFDVSWFTDVAAEAPANARRVRAWDLAGTTGERSKYTAGVRMARTPRGEYFVEDVVRFKRRPGERDELILATARADGVEVEIVLEQEPADAGIKQVEDQVKMLAGFNANVTRASGDKVTRAGPVARQAAVRNVRLVSGAWNSAFLDELTAFPGLYTDQVDALAHAFNHLANAGIPGAAVGKGPTARIGTKQLFPQAASRQRQRIWTPRRR